MSIRFEPRRPAALVAAFLAAVAFGPSRALAAQKPEDPSLRATRQRVVDLQSVLDQKYGEVVDEREMSLLLGVVKNAVAAADLKLVRYEPDAEDRLRSGHSAAQLEVDVEGRFSAVQDFLYRTAELGRVVVVYELHAKEVDKETTKATLLLLVPYAPPAARVTGRETSAALDQRVKDLEAQIAVRDDLRKRTWLAATFLRSTASRLAPTLPALRCETIDITTDEVKMTGLADRPDLISELAKTTELHTDGAGSFRLDVARHDSSSDDGHPITSYSFVLTGTVDTHAMPAIDKLESDARSAPPVEISPAPAPTPSRPVVLLPTFDQRYRDYTIARGHARRDHIPVPSAVGLYVIDELTVTGLYETAAGTGVFVQATPTGATFFVEPGTRVYDGELVSVERLADAPGARVVFRQVHKIATGTVRTEEVKEVVKTLTPATMKAATPQENREPIR